MGDGMLFRECELDASIQKALDKLGYEEMYEVQQKVIPLLCAKENVVVQARTGSGKTAAYLLPLIQNIIWEEKEAQALILVPTRELALQVKEEFDMLSTYRRLKSVAIFGKQPYKFQIEDLKQRTHVVIGTPGRVLDHLKRGTLSLRSLSYVVIDEADEMLKMGFFENMKEILSYLPVNCVSCLCSATMPEKIQELIMETLPNAHVLHIKEEEMDISSLSQCVYEVAEKDKLSFLEKLLCMEQPDTCMIFAKTQERVRNICEDLHELGMDVDMLHGGMLQEDRIMNINDFKKGKLRILACSDVGARGIDVQDVSHIINYDVPKNGEVYIHRMGRTARANGLQGKIISLISDDNKERIQELESYLGYSLMKGEKEKVEQIEIQEEMIHHLKKPQKEKRKKNEELKKDTCKLYINKGKSKKIRAGDIVGAICQIEGIQSEDIGVIQVQEHQSYVDILNGKGKEVLKALNQKTIKGKKIKVEIAKEN